MKCPYCDTFIRPDETICTGCGYKNPEYNPNAYKEEKKSTTNSHNTDNLNKGINNFFSTDKKDNSEYTYKKVNIGTVFILVVLCCCFPILGVPLLLLYIFSKREKK